VNLVGKTIHHQDSCQRGDWRITAPAVLLAVAAAALVLRALSN
jgi:hypothetical protein